MRRSSARVAIVAAACLGLSACSAGGALESLVSAKVHDDRASAACIAAFPEGLVGADNLAAAADSTVGSVRKFAASYDAKADAVLRDADTDEYAAICVISGDLVRDGKTTGNLAIYVLSGTDRRGELAAF